MEQFSRSRDTGRPRTDGHSETNITRLQAKGKEYRSLRQKTSDFLNGGKGKRLQEQEKRIEATAERFKNDQEQMWRDQREKETKQHLKDLEAEVGRYVKSRFDIQDKLNRGQELEAISDAFGEDKVVWMKGFERQMEDVSELRLHVQDKLEERRVFEQSYRQRAYDFNYSEWCEGIGRDGPPPRLPEVVEFPTQVDLPFRPPVYSDNHSSQNEMLSNS